MTSIPAILQPNGVGKAIQQRLSPAIRKNYKVTPHFSGSDSVKLHVKFGLAHEPIHLKASETPPLSGQADVDLFEGVLLVDSARTPWIKPNAAKTSEMDLAKVAAAAVVNRTNLQEDDVNYSLWGNVRQTNGDASFLAQNIPRMIGLGDVNGHNLSELCGSSALAVVEAAKKAVVHGKKGDNYTVLVGGAEHMTTPYILNGLLPLVKQIGADEQQKWDKAGPVGKVFSTARILGLHPLQAFKLMRSGLTTKQAYATAAALGHLAPEWRKTLASLVAEEKDKGRLEGEFPKIVNPFNLLSMGDTSENLLRDAGLFGDHIVTGKELDALALRSHERAVGSWLKRDMLETVKGTAGPEVVPLINQLGRPIAPTIDAAIQAKIDTGGFVEGPDGRALPKDANIKDALTTNPDKMARLRERQHPFLHNATRANALETPATASGVVSGSVAGIITTQEGFKHFQKEGKFKDFAPLGEITASAAVTVPPEIMGLGAARAAQILLNQTGLKLADVGLFEINEAFAGVLKTAVSVMAKEDGSLSESELLERTNIDGGSIAIGHPLAATGLRLIGHVLRALKERDQEYGIATMCEGDGRGRAVLVRNPDCSSPTNKARKPNQPLRDAG